MQVHGECPPGKNETLSGREGFVFVGRIADHLFEQPAQMVRVFESQFVTRENVNKDLLTRFEELLRDYFTSDKPQSLGLPSVAWCADRLHLSANYFGDLIKKETGKSAQEYIQLTTIDRAKELLTEGGRSVSEIAYELGFRYPQHFTRLFKKCVGMSPNEYRTTN